MAAHPSSQTDVPCPHPPPTGTQSLDDTNVPCVWCGVTTPCRDDKDLLQNASLCRECKIQCDKDAKEEAARIEQEEAAAK